MSDVPKTGAVAESINFDPEKNAGNTEVTSSSSSGPDIVIPSKLLSFNQRIESLAGLEARGITRVLPEERHEETLLGLVSMAFLWFSANLTANNLAVGFLGPLVFELGFVDSALCAVFGAFVGSALTAYMSIWGAQSGNRTMVRNTDILVPATNPYDVSCHQRDAAFFDYGKLTWRHRLLHVFSWVTGLLKSAFFLTLLLWSGTG
jgi:hypothetical protein